MQTEELAEATKHVDKPEETTKPEGAEHDQVSQPEKTAAEGQPQSEDKPIPEDVAVSPSEQAKPDDSPIVDETQSSAAGKKELIVPTVVPQEARTEDSPPAQDSAVDTLKVEQSSPEKGRSQDTSASVSPEKNKSAGNPNVEDEGTSKKKAVGGGDPSNSQGTGTGAKASTSTTKEKLKALEDKYKEKLKENAAQKEEVAKLTKILFEVYRELGFAFDEPSEYKMGESGTAAFLKKTFAEGWVFQQRKQSAAQKLAVEEALATQRRSHEEEIAQIQKKSAEEAASKQQQLTESLVKSTKAVTQKQQEEALEHMREGYEKSLRNLEELNAKIQSDYSSLLGTLRAKEEEIGQLRTKNLELSNQAADSLMERFEQIEESDISAHLQRSSRTDDLIRLRNELETAQARIEELERSKATVGQLSVSTGQVSGSVADRQEQATQTERSLSDPQRSSFSAKANGGPYHEKLEEKLEREMVLAKKNEEEAISSGYFKDLVVRYMVFEAKRNEQECNVLRRAILDFLKVESASRALIDDAVTGKGSLKDSINILKFFGGGS